ncbi:MAG TPA: DUF6011 domain-containing protein [Streptomyces sp.]|nr:DUF6011 domain-containing protein [Streptomyces sp.]
MTAVPTPAPLPGVDPPAGPDGERPRVVCRLCGRPLRDPEARLWGLGHGCRDKLALRTAPRSGPWEVEQEALPGL